jgi:hypothetical protein
VRRGRRFQVEPQAAMSPRPAWLDAKDDPPVSPAVMLRSEAATTWPTRSARLTLPLLTGRSAATRRILHIAAGLDEARQAERDAQRQVRRPLR